MMVDKNNVCMERAILCWQDLSMVSSWKSVSIDMGIPGISLGMRPANERRCFNVMTSLIGWAHIQTDPWITVIDER